MRNMLDSMSRPKFYLFSALNNSLLKLLLIRVAQISDKTDYSGEDGGVEMDEARIIELYRREYFGSLCKWAPDFEDEVELSEEGQDKYLADPNGGFFNASAKTFNIESSDAAGGLSPDRFNDSQLRVDTDQYPEEYDDKNDGN